jgi:hypothetical protein
MSQRLEIHDDGWLLEFFFIPFALLRQNPDSRKHPPILHREHPESSGTDRLFKWPKR